MTYIIMDIISSLSATPNSVQFPQHYFYPVYPGPSLLGHIPYLCPKFDFPLFLFVKVRPD